MTTPTRRKVLGGGATILGLSLAGMTKRAFAAERPLQIFGHRTHEASAIAGNGGDVASTWSHYDDVGLSWSAFDIQPLQERTLRELSLSSTDVDVAFVLSPQITDNLANLVEALDGRMENDPPEEPGDVFDAMYDGLSSSGKLLAMPYRGAIAGFHCNEVILAERGYDAPPSTIEEMYEIALATTHERNGVKVTGLALPITYQAVVQLAHAFDGDIITSDIRCAMNNPAMVKTVEMIAELYKAGAIPRNAANMTTEDPITMMQTGRAALYTGGYSRTAVLNNPERSQFAGKIIPIPMPISHDLADTYDYAPGVLEVWGMMIPKNSSRKDLAWDFIKHMTSPGNQKLLQLNGNSTVRASVYNDPEIQAQLPYARAALNSLSNARVALPAFDESARVADIFKQHVELAMLGQMQPQDAMDAACEEIEPLLPAL